METKNKTAKGATKTNTSKTVVKTSVKKPADPAKKAASEKSKKEVAAIKAKTAVKTPAEITKEKREIEAGIIAARKAEKEKKETERKSRLEAKKAEAKKNAVPKYSLSQALIDGIKALKKGGTKKELFESADKFYQEKAKPKTDKEYTFKISDYVLPSLVCCGFLLKSEEGVYTINPKYK